MSETIQVQMLGEFTIRYGDCVISDSNDRSHRVWSLLAYLLVNHRREFTQEEMPIFLKPMRRMNSMVSSTRVRRP